MGAGKEKLHIFYQRQEQQQAFHRHGRPEFPHVQGH